MYIDFSDVIAGLVDSKYSKNSGNQNSFYPRQSSHFPPPYICPVSWYANRETGVRKTLRLNPGAYPSFLQENPCLMVVNERKGSPPPFSPIISSVHLHPGEAQLY